MLRNRETLLVNGAWQPLICRLMGNALTFDGVTQSSHIELPARLVIAGGWTDTPPQCLMSPGGVFNIAITVHGKLPIQASVTPIQQSNILELVSEDQMVTESFQSWEDLYKDIELDSAMGLHKVCVAVLFDRNLRYQLGHHVQGEPERSNFPCGFRLSTRSYLPKGSGLGASSILALAIVKALKMSCNLDLSQDKEMHIVLSIEQVLGKTLTIYNTFKRQNHFMTKLVRSLLIPLFSICKVAVEDGKIKLEPCPVVS